jgi:deoxyadenosine/deoxycytidine kinase
MGKLITVVGNTGVGKTTLTRLLGEKTGFITGLEGHQERPFQAHFKLDPHYTLANQVDYLLLRAEQEQAIRASPDNGIQDGGLEMDFFVFSRLFLQNKLLTDEEYALLDRMYRTLRTFLPPPDVIISMNASPEVVMARYKQRERPLEIATAEDVRVIDGLLCDWLSHADPQRIIPIDASGDDPSYANIIPNLMDTLGNLTGKKYG